MSATDLDELRIALRRYVGDVAAPDAVRVRRRARRLVRGRERRRATRTGVLLLVAVAASVWSLAASDDSSSGDVPMPPVAVDSSDLLDAARRGDLDEARRLVEMGAAVDVTGAYGLTPLMISAVRSDTRLAELLLDAGARPHVRDRHGRTSIHLAARFGATGVIELLVAEGVSPDERVPVVRTTPMMVAAVTGDAGVVRTLAGLGADLDATDVDGLTALDHARAWSTSAAAERTLLQLGASDRERADRVTVP